MFQTGFINYLSGAVADRDPGLMSILAKGGGEIVPLRANLKGRIEA
jgi:hypothetical protein